MGKTKVVHRKKVRSGMDVRARSKIVIQKPRIDTMSQEERRRRVVELNRAICNIDHPSSEYEFMLTKTKKSSVRKAMKIFKNRVMSTGTNNIFQNSFDE